MKKPLIALFLAIFIHFSSQPLHAQSPTIEPDQETTPSATPTPLLPPEPPQSGISLTISPISLNLNTDPGQEISSQFKVKNDSNITEYLEIGISKFQRSGSGGEMSLVAVAPDDEFLSWVSFSEDQFTLDANQTKTINLTISPSEDAGLGYYYAFTINRIQEKEAEERETIVTGAPAIPLLLEVNNPSVKRELQLIDFSADRTFYEYLPTTFSIKVQNTGNIHLSPSGDIFIDQGAKKDIAVIRANPGRSNILPDTDRTFTSSWDDAPIIRVPKEENGRVLKDDQGNTIYTLKKDLSKGDKFRIGKYTAHLLLVYDNGQRDIPLEAQLSFWVVPVRLILALVITMAVLISIGLLVGVKMGKKRSVKTNIKQ